MLSFRDVPCEAAVEGIDAVRAAGTDVRGDVVLEYRRLS